MFHGYIYVISESSQVMHITVDSEISKCVFAFYFSLADRCVDITLQIQRMQPFAAAAASSAFGCKLFHRLMLHSKNENINIPFMLLFSSFVWFIDGSSARNAVQFRNKHFGILLILNRPLKCSSLAVMFECYVVCFIKRNLRFPFRNCGILI